MMMSGQSFAADPLSGYWEFRPLTVYLGAGIAGMAWIGLVIFMLVDSKRIGKNPVSKL